MALWKDAFINKNGFPAFSMHVSVGMCRERVLGGVATLGGANISKFGAAGWTWGAGTWWAGVQTPLRGAASPPGWGGARRRRLSSTENIRGTSSSGTRPAGPPLPAMCGPRRCRWGPGGDFVAGGFGGRPGSSAAPAPGALRSWPHSCRRTKISPGRAAGGGAGGAPHTTLTPLSLPGWGCGPRRAVGLGMQPEPSRLPALSSGPEIAPWVRPARAAAAPARPLPHLLPPHHSDGFLGGPEWC